MCRKALLIKATPAGLGCGDSGEDYFVALMKKIFKPKPASGHLGITRIVKGDRISHYPVQVTAYPSPDGEEVGHKPWMAIVRR